MVRDHCKEGFYGEGSSIKRRKGHCDVTYIRNNIGIHYIFVILFFWTIIPVTFYDMFIIVINCKCLITIKAIFMCK